MITGIIVFVLFIIVCLRSFDKRVLRKRGIFTKIHFPVAIALILVSVLHIILTIPFFPSRTLPVLLTGTFSLLFILVAFLSGIRKKIKVHRIFSLFACLFIIGHVIFNIIGVVRYQNQVKSIVIHDIDLSGIADGIYIGECNVTFIYTKVAVTVKLGKIINIDILEHRNERGKPAERIINDILKQQRIDIDAVSGATNSGYVIKKAIENALNGK